ncbi:MAG: hypothetical protein AAB289_02955, partial [Chloroflexota bacterium]
MARTCFLSAPHGAAPAAMAALLLTMVACSSNPVVASSPPATSGPREIKVAVSANARPLFEALLPEFQRRTGIATLASYAASEYFP